MKLGHVQRHLFAQLSRKRMRLHRLSGQGQECRPRAFRRFTRDTTFNTDCQSQSRYAALDFGGCVNTGTTVFCDSISGVVVSWKPKAALLAFDLSDPTPELQVIEDSRCGGTWAMAPFADEEGNVYAMGDWSAGYYQVGVPSSIQTPACLLRVKPGADEFDPAYYVNLLDILDARAVRNAFAMADGHLLLSIWPNSVPAPTKEQIQANLEIFYDMDQFRYVVLNVKTLQATPVTDLGEGGAGSATPLVIDNRTFLQVYVGENSADLYEVKTDGTATKIIEAGPNSDFEMIGRVR